MTGSEAMDGEGAALAAFLGEQYQVTRRLGRGAYGVVHLVRDRILHRALATKTLRLDLAEQSEMRDGFRVEARTLARLQHPGIVPLLSYAERGMLCAMVMPFVSGESLDARLQREPRLPSAEVRRVLMALADALAYAHRQGVVHRDVKPHNVLLDAAFDPPRPLLVDFGVSALPTRDRNVNAGRETVGTLHYMSPEQAFGEHQLDHRGDIFALGVLGYRMLSGRLPFDGATPSAVLHAITRGEFAPLAQVIPNTPSGLAAIIERCLAPDPSRRWRTSGELRDQLLDLGQRRTLLDMVWPSG
ncbi:MAG: serine/threonine-protein kinase [Gemmatimonadaceae bacterium]